jgi:hypothetical protein
MPTELSELLSHYGKIRSKWDSEAGWCSGKESLYSIGAQDLGQDTVYHGWGLSCFSLVPSKNFREITSIKPLPSKSFPDHHCTMIYSALNDLATNNALKYFTQKEKYRTLRKGPLFMEYGTGSNLVIWRLFILKSYMQILWKPKRLFYLILSRLN